MTKGIALADMISGIYDLLMTIKLPPQSRIYLLDHLANTEYVNSLNLWQSCLRTDPFAFGTDTDSARVVRKNSNSQASSAPSKWPSSSLRKSDHKSPVLYFRTYIK